MSKNKGKQFNIEKRAIISRMVAKSNKAKEIGEILRNYFPRFLLIETHFLMTFLLWNLIRMEN